MSNNVIFPRTIRLVVVLVTATGFVASQLRTRLYIAIGVVAGAFSVVVGLLFLLGADDALPDLQRLLGGG